MHEIGLGFRPAVVCLFFAGNGEVFVGDMRRAR